MLRARPLRPRRAGFWFLLATPGPAVPCPTWHFSRFPLAAAADSSGHVLPQRGPIWSAVCLYGAGLSVASFPSPAAPGPLEQFVILPGVRERPLARNPSKVPCAVLRSPPPGKRRAHGHRVVLTVKQNVRKTCHSGCLSVCPFQDFSSVSTHSTSPGVSRRPLLGSGHHLRFSLLLSNSLPQQSVF